MNENELSYAIIGAAIEVHKELGGPGLLEDVYEEALCYELQLRGMTVQRQARFRVNYKGKELKKRLVMDLIVNGIVLIEVKAVEHHHEVYEAQLLTYLRQTNRKLGLVINFGQPYVKQGIHRVANGLEEPNQNEL
jgi:GxxExxY protein